MSKPGNLSRAAVFALELLIVTLAVLIGAEIAQNYRLIPKSIMRLPSVGFGADDIAVVIKSTLFACGVAFLGARVFAGWDVFGSARRVATEVYALVVGIVAAALYQFLFTQVNFSPELLLDLTLVAIFGFLLAYLVFGSAGAGLGARLGGFFGSLFGLLRRPAAWLVVLFALTPVFVGRQFVADRDFANWVTRLRVASNVSSDNPYRLANGLGEATFTTPIMVQFADSDPNTIYVLTRGGELWRADYPSGGNRQLLLNLSDKLGYVEMENGALGFDLHPEFGRAGSPNTAFVYIYYTQYGPERQINHLTRYDLGQPTPDARRASAQSLIEQGRPNDGYHNAGMVEFGRDGMLYLAVGEGGLPECLQRIDCALVGGILRIDVDRRGGTISRPILRQPEGGRSANYFIPLDNPYADRGEGALGEFWAHGLRNPFRFGFDPANGQMIAGEVGSTEWEEVVRVVRGGNYQFPYIEGFAPQKRYPKPAAIEGTEQPPVLTYKHTAFLRSVIGGTVYRGRTLPELDGKYIFADNYSGEIMAIPADARRAESWEVIARSRDVAQRGLTAIVTAPDGQLLVTVMGDNDTPTGIVAKLVPADSEEGQRAGEAEAREEQRIADARQAQGPASAAMLTGVSLAEAKSVYGVNCARCHGAEGLGDGPDSQDLGAWVPSFQDANFHRWRTDEEIIAALVGGGEAVGQSAMMPPWKDVLSQEEIVGLKNYVRSFRPAANANGDQP